MMTFKQLQDLRAHNSKICHVSELPYSAQHVHLERYMMGLAASLTKMKIV